MANAIKSLVNDDEEPAASDKAAAPDSTTTTMPAPDVVAPAPATPEATAPKETAKPEEDSSDDSMAVAHKKIISPITDQSTVQRQPDLNELLAKEGFTPEDIHTENQPSPQNPTGLPPAPHPPGHVISPNPADPGQNGGVDPNSIAL